MFKLEIEPNKTLHTIYGNANITPLGYYRITSKKQGNYGKLLHRLIWEKWYGKIPKNIHIHHIDGNKLNCCIYNLKPMTNSEHNYFHNVNTKHSDEHCFKTSKSSNTTGYFRVSKQYSNRYSQGFIWRYGYYDDGKRKAIYSVDLKNLEEKVKDKNLIWKKLG